MLAKKGWDTIAQSYQKKTQISLEDVHYGPISPGESQLRLLGDVRKKDILEVGCGGGQNAIVLAKQGARPVGIDISGKQLRYAWNLAGECDVEVSFLVNTMNELSMRDESFDIVLSSCAIGYSENLGKVFDEAFRVLRRSGLFVFCVVHPLANRGRRVTYGGRQMWGIGNYFDRRRSVWRWRIEEKEAKFYGYGRTFQDYFNALVSPGFVVEKILEPEPFPLDKMTLAERGRIPYFEEGYLRDYDVWRKIPFTLLFKTRKP